MKFIVYVSLFLQIMYLPQLTYADENIQILNAWIREAPPAASVSAAYMVIKNHTQQPQKLVSVSSDDFQIIELHQTITKNGTMMMEEQGEIAIPAQSQIELKPGGYHLMMMMRKRKLVEGDQVKITMSYADGRNMLISVPVLKQAPGE